MPKKRTKKQTKKKSTGSPEVRIDQQTAYCDIAELSATNRTLRRWIEADAGLDAYCFTRDLTQSVVPYTLDDKVVVTLDPADRDIERLISGALKEGPYRHRLDRAVVAFIRQVTNTIAHFGSAEFEIVLERTEGASAPTGFRLVYVPPNTIQRRPFRWVQDIGSRRAAELGRSRFLPIDRTKIVRFELPRPFNVRRWFRMKRRLSYFGSHPIPQFNLGFTEQLRTYDFGAAVALKDLAVAEIMRDIGWHATASLDKHALDSYAFIRELRFHRFVASLREAILLKLNVALAYALPQFGARGEISVSGLSRQDDFDRIEAAFVAGADLRVLLRQLYGRE